MRDFSASVKNVKKEALGYSFIGKFKGMKKEEIFTIYQKLVRGRVLIQSDKRVGLIGKDGKLLITPPTKSKMAPLGWLTTCMRNKTAYVVKLSSKDTETILDAHGSNQRKAKRIARDVSYSYNRLLKLLNAKNLSEAEDEIKFLRGCEGC